MWKNRLSRLFIVLWVSYVRQTHIHGRTTNAWAECFEVETATEKRKETSRQKLIKSKQNWLKQGIGQFALRSKNISIQFGIRRNCLRRGRSQSLYLFVRRYCSNYTGKLLLSATSKIQSNILPSWLTPYAKEIIGDHQWGFDGRGQLLIIHSAYIKHLRKKRYTTKQCISYL